MPNYLIDPLAQSFFINTPTIITKVDLFFSAKDASLPFITHIRKNVNGVPSNYIVPFSEKAVYGTDVNISANANVATTVTFESPIYLDTGEYSITLGSSSKNFRVWVSELDNLDKVSGKRITEQPYVGSLFKSQNSSTWTPEQSQDLKFKLYRAVFNTDVTATVNLTPENNYERRSLVTDPLELFPGSTTMRVQHANHGLLDGGYVKISGLNNNLIIGTTTLFYGINVTAIDQVTFSVSNVTLNSYTVNLATAPDANIAVATRFGGIAVNASQDIQYDTIYPTIAAVTPTNAKLTQSFKGTSTSYVFDTTSNEINVDNETELDETKILGGDISTIYSLGNTSSYVHQIELSSINNFVAPLLDTKQLNLVLVKNLIDNPTFASHNLLYDLLTVANSSANVTLTKESNSFGRFALSGTSDQANALSLISGTFINLTGNNLSSGSQYRVIEVTDNGANVKVADLSGSDIITEPSGNTFILINGRNFVSEEAPTGGTALSKYVTRQFDFVTPASSINFRLDVHKPAGAEVKVYFKTKLVGESDILASKEYIELSNITIPTALADEFYEVEKQVDDLPLFNSLVLKIVFLGTNSAGSPKITNLRLITLA